MTWSLSGTISAGTTYQEKWRDFFDNHLNGLSAWTVSAHPGGDTNKRSLRYDYTDAVDSTTKSYYYWYGNSSSLYEDATYTTTPGDLGTSTTNAVTMYSNTGTWKIWTSDVNPASMIMTHGKNFIFNWFEPASIYQPFNYPVSGAASNRGVILFPRMTNNVQYAANLGQSSTSASEQSMTPDVTGNINSFYYSCDFARYYDTYNLTQATKQHASFLYYSQSDVLVHVPAGSYGSTHGNNIVTGTGATIFDGTNYYLRTDSNLNNAAFLINFGTTEPTF